MWGDQKKGRILNQQIARGHLMSERRLKEVVRGLSSTGIPHSVVEPGEGEGSQPLSWGRSSREVDPGELGVLEAMESKPCQKHGWISCIEYC